MILKSRLFNSRSEIQQRFFKSPIIIEMPILTKMFNYEKKQVRKALHK
jgi:hypothetical protein